MVLKIRVPTYFWKRRDLFLDTLHRSRDREVGIIEDRSL